MATRVITIGIIQAANNEYALHASEMYQTSIRNSISSSDTSEKLNYPDVLAVVGAGECTAEIRNPNGSIMAAASLSVFVDNGVLVAAYALTRNAADRGAQTEKGSINLLEMRGLGQTNHIAAEGEYDK